jgi:hypothetical protein
MAWGIGPGTLPSVRIIRRAAYRNIVAAAPCLQSNRPAEVGYRAAQPKF